MIILRFRGEKKKKKQNNKTSIYIFFITKLGKVFTLKILNPNNAMQFESIKQINKY